MKEILVMSLLLFLAVLLWIVRLTLFDMVLYDKVIHMTIGVFFGVVYFANFPDDNPLIISAVFSLIYEIFVYVFYNVIFLVVLGRFDTLQSPLEFFTAFFLNYLSADEWFDVIVAFLGVFAGKYVRSERGFL